MKERKEFTALFRVWHWLTVFSVLGLIGTVILRKTFLSKSANADIIQNKLASISITINHEQAISIAKAIRAEMWHWHYVLAVVLGVAIFIRVVAIIRGDAELPIVKFIRAEGVQEKAKTAVHLLICLVLMLMVLSGTFYYYHDTLGFAKESVKWVKEIHETLFTPLVILIALHIAGVIKHELSTKECIVSKMIHGE